jgi:cytochrome c oxidase subunit 2
MFKKLFILALSFIAVSAFLQAGGDAAAGKASYTVCVACHGPDGAGMQALNSPAIAGQEEWYIKRQLEYFKKGIRGADATKDLYGSQMRPMAMTLATPEAVENVAAYVASLKPVKPPVTTKGDAAKGKASYAVCATCHGQDAKGIEAMNAPNMTIQQDWYIIRQLHNFKNGVRGKHPEDIYGMQMAPMAMTLPSEEAINDVVAYILSLR